MQQTVTSEFLLWDRHTVACSVRRALFPHSYWLREHWHSSWGKAAVYVTLRDKSNLILSIRRDPDVIGKIADYKLDWNIRSGAFRMEAMSYKRLSANGTMHVLEHSNIGHHFYSAQEQGYPARPLWGYSAKRLDLMSKRIIAAFRPET